MKNKKSLLSLVIFALVLILGVGYAVVSSVGLTIGGTASVKNANLKVDIESVADTKTSGATISHTLTTHADKDTFTITDMELNETVTMEYTVANHEKDVNAKLTGVELTNNNEQYFDVNYTINGETIDANDGTTTVTVTVKLIKTPVTEAQGTTTVSLTLNAAPKNNSN